MSWVPQIYIRLTIQPLSGWGVISDLKSCNIFSRRRGGGGRGVQRPFKKIPKIHPFLKRQASISVAVYLYSYFVFLTKSMSDIGCKGEKRGMARVRVTVAPPPGPHGCRSSQ